MKNNLGASSLREDRAASPSGLSRASASSQSGIPLRGAKIRLWINHAHVARVLEIKRALCVGEEVRAA